MEAADVVAVATGSISERDVGFLAPTIDVATVADADDGSFVVLADMSPDPLRTLALIVGLVDAQLLELAASLSASCTSFLLFRALDLDGIIINLQFESLRWYVGMLKCAIMTAAPIEH